MAGPKGRDALDKALLHVPLWRLQKCEEEYCQKTVQRCWCSRLHVYQQWDIGPLWVSALWSGRWPDSTRRWHGNSWRALPRIQGFRHQKNNWESQNKKVCILLQKRSVQWMWQSEMYWTNGMVRFDSLFKVMLMMLKIKIFFLGTISLVDSKTTQFRSTTKHSALKSMLKRKSESLRLKGERKL